MIYPIVIGFVTLLPGPGILSHHNLLGVGLLSGAGFTMSILIAHLAFDSSSATLESAKLAIVVASAIAAVIAYIVLRFGSKEPRE